ncbi:MAG: DUF2497 domain-containing protein [Hyphomicrobium sp.]|nr:DUF2497 domain-containing protein [Hyphomicrobium sp.]
MSRPEDRTEPSMEEILASIRKIIAEEPNQARPAATPDPTPRLTEPPPKSSPWNSGIELPMGRAKGIAENTEDSSTPTAAQNSSAPPHRLPLGNIDPDLADLLDTPSTSAAPSPAEPAPLAKSTTSPGFIPASAAQKSSASPAPSVVAAAREKWESRISPNRAPEKPAEKPAENSAEKPASSATPTAAADPEHVTSQSAPAQSPVQSYAAHAASEAANTTSKPAASTPAPPSANLPPFGLTNRATGFYPPPGFRVEPTASPAASGDGIEAAPTSAAPASSAPAPAAPAPVAKAAPMAVAATVPQLKPDAPRPATTANAPKSEASASSDLGAKIGAIASDNPAAAAAAALDALNAGLAAVSAASPSPVFAPAVAHAPSASPVISTAATSAAPAPTMTATAPSASSGTAPGRSLEDAVAEMLKPMLEKWITENMPRIVERALRLDAQGHNGSKPGGNGGA